MLLKILAQSEEYGQRSEPIHTTENCIIARGSAEAGNST